MAGDNARKPRFRKIQFNFPKFFYRGTPGPRRFLHGRHSRGKAVTTQQPIHMKNKIILKSLILSAVAALGLAPSAFAGGDEPNTPASVPASGTPGLLGQTYAGLTYSYVDLNRSSSHADDYHFDYNESLKSGLDGVLSYDWTQSNSQTKQQSLRAGLRAFSAAYVWGKPYVEAGAGYTWEKVAGVKDNSFLWQAGLGVEFQAAPAVTVTPFIRYSDAPSLSQRDKWDFGVKANYWVDRQWAVTAGLVRDDHQNMTYTVGTNFRF